MVPSITTAMTVPGALKRLPRKSVAPRKTAAKAWIRYGDPTAAEPWLNFAVARTPARPARPAERTRERNRMRAVRMPARRAASGPSPVA